MPKDKSSNRNNDQQDRGQGRNGIERHRRTVAEGIVVDESEDALLAKNPGFACHPHGEFLLPQRAT